MSRDQHVDEKARQGSEGIGRREFLQSVGFSVASASMVGCTRGLEHEVVPFLQRPEEITPGRSYWYASVCGACPAACGILAKNRDGRPIKLEGNARHPISGGGLCAIGQASVLELYDRQRLRRPLRDGKPATWDDVDAAVADALRRLERSSGRVRFLTDTTTGPAEREAIATFLARFEDARLVTCDSASVSAIAAAHEETHGVRRVPRYRFDRARLVVSFDADFLGAWLSPVEHAAGYAASRRLPIAGRAAGTDGAHTEDGEGSDDQLQAERTPFSEHIQLESRLSLTGCKADRRVVVPPRAAGSILTHLVARLSDLAHEPPPWRTLGPCPVDEREVVLLAEKLWRAPRGSTLVVCGESSVEVQRLVNFVNQKLGNYSREGVEATLDLEAYSGRGSANDGALRELLDELEAGAVDALLVRGINPVYGLPEGEKIAAALERVGLTISFSPYDDETAQVSTFVCPEPHFLEQWGDSEPAAGIAAVRQPVIRTIGDSRPMLESLATWSGRTARAYDQVRDFWRRQVHPRALSAEPFEEFWNRALTDGFVTLRVDAKAPTEFDSSSISTPVSRLPAAVGEMRLELHSSLCVGDGRHALNPWLQELPDPIAKTVWTNHAAVAPTVAAELGIETGDVVRIDADGGLSMELPAVIQPGQSAAAVVVSLGYGRKGTERFETVGPQWWEGRPTVEPGHHVGVNAAPFLYWQGSELSYSGRRVRLTKTARHEELARTQQYDLLEVPARLAGDERRRPILREATFAGWLAGSEHDEHGHHEYASLWPDHPKEPHHWGMVIDLTACTGCSGCVAACQAENNVPVVGKDEVRRGREMHWIRLDRYYDEEALTASYMPMMCQHCDNAPCETVCPVLATVQSAEGLNQQVYNRCVGTRYCANNCPYKVRRFNWFEYVRDDELENLVLNPDVTVRSRGVMEKCSLCVQRIQDAKAEARREGRTVADGEIVPACAQSCPTKAIVFGDSNDPESELSKARRDPRHYFVLEELGIKPIVGYMTSIRNRTGVSGADSHE